MGWLLNIFRRWWRGRVERRFLRSLESEAAEELLKWLLKLMGLAFKLDGDFRQNIQGFTGKYQFRSADNSVTVAALFRGNGLKVQERLIPDPDVSVIFKDGRSLMDFLLSADRDILRLLLNNEVVLRGNANYVFKFAYMANHLQLALTGRLP
jgi:hypothetical protein